MLLCANIGHCYTKWRYQYENLSLSTALEIIFHDNKKWEDIDNRIEAEYKVREGCLIETNEIDGYRSMVSGIDKLRDSGIFSASKMFQIKSQ